MDFNKITREETNQLIAEADELRKFLGQELAQAPTAGDTGLWVVAFERQLHHLLGRLVPVTEHELRIEDGEEEEADAKEEIKDFDLPSLTDEEVVSLLKLIVDCIRKT